MFYRYLFSRPRPLLFWAGLLTSLLVFRAAAQTPVPDTTRLQYGEEIALPTDQAPLRVQQQQRGLWKLGLNNFLLGARSFGPDINYTRYGIHLAYERRLPQPAWSVQGEISPAVARVHTEAGTIISRSLSVRAQLAGRYYYNLEQRLRQGHSNGDFSGNYISLALGAGTGRQAHESPFYFFSPNGRWVRPDAALLHGAQLRLGQYGFVDLASGISSPIYANRFRLNFNAILRVGLAVTAPAKAVYTKQPRLVDQDEALRPRAYVGLQAGVYSYSLRYSKVNPYPPTIGSYGQGYGLYEREIRTPAYVYAGYYLIPRLAVQIGVQRQTSRAQSPAVSMLAVFKKIDFLDQRELALPVLLRYSLTRSFLQRVQFDALGGLVPLWSSVRFQGEQLFTEQRYAFKRSTYALHASLGLSASYGFGRRRRVLATTEWVASRNLGSNSQAIDLWHPGGSVGLRYRFGYR